MSDASTRGVPTAVDILDGLIEIANRATGVAIAWHVAIAAALAALAVGWRPSRRAASALIGLPLASVAIVSLVFGNPFNGTIFAVATLALTALAFAGPHDDVRSGPLIGVSVGIAMIAFGWFYPHFLRGDPVMYLYAAPVGLVPCPTLSLAIGLALLGGGFGMRAWSLTLAGLGAFYALFGTLVLGVWIDLALLAGSVALATTALGHPASMRPAWTRSLES